LPVLLPFTYLFHFVIWSISLPYGDIVVLIIVKNNRQLKVAQDGSGWVSPEFHVDFGSGLVGLGHFTCG